MSLRNRSIILLAAAMLLASCHSTKEVTLPPPPPSPRTDAAPAMPCEKTVTNFTASVDGMSVNGQLRMANDSVMWLSITKIIELGRALATPDSVWTTFLALAPASSRRKLKHPLRRLPLPKRQLSKL